MFTRVCSRFLVGAIAVGGALVSALPACAPFGGSDRDPLPVAELPVDPATLEPDVATAIRDAHRDYLNAPDDIARIARLAALFATTNLYLPAAELYDRAVALEPHQRQWRYYRGLMHERSGDYAKAIDDFRSVAATSPPYAPAFWRLGRALVETGNLDGARHAFQQYARLRPYCPLGAYGLGLVEFTSGHPEQALPLLERAARRIPDYAPAPYTFGLALSRLGHTDEAERWLYRARRGTQDPPLDDRLAAQLTVTVGSRSALFTLARRYAAQGRTDEAIRIFRSLTERPGQPVRPYAALVTTLLQANRTHEAESVAREFLRRFPRRPEPHFAMALVLRHRNRLREALASIDRAIAIDEALPDLHFERARLLFALDDRDAAMAALRRGLSLEPDYALGHAALAQLLREAGNLTEALEHARNGVRYDPAEPFTFVQLGETLAALGRTSEAAHAFEEAIQLDPTDSHTRRRLEALRALLAQSGPTSGDRPQHTVSAPTP